MGPENGIPGNQIKAISMLDGEGDQVLRIYLRCTRVLSGKDWSVLEGLFSLRHHRQRSEPTSVGAVGCARDWHAALGERKAEKHKQFGMPSIQ
jgi:hypothetical protein